MKNSICEECAYNSVNDKYCCDKCIRNPNITDMFKSIGDYYPLELNKNHIHLWEKTGKTKYSIAMFKYSKGGECWDLEFVGKRPLDKRVNSEKFFELVRLGYKSLEGKEEA